MSSTETNMGRQGTYCFSRVVEKRTLALVFGEGERREEVTREKNEIFARDRWFEEKTEYFRLPPHVAVAGGFSGKEKKVKGRNFVQGSAINLVRAVILGKVNPYSAIGKVLQVSETLSKHGRKCENPEGRRGEEWRGRVAGEFGKTFRKNIVHPAWGRGGQRWGD